jgi:hypothetical protein
VVGVLLQILVVEGAEVVGIFGLVLLDIGLIYPQEGVHEPDGVVSKTGQFLTWAYAHSIQRGSNISHHRHKEEGHLEHGVLKEVQAIYDAFVPGGMVHIDEEGCEP